MPVNINGVEFSQDCAGLDRRDCHVDSSPPHCVFKIFDIRHVKSYYASFYIHARSTSFSLAPSLMLCARPGVILSGISWILFESCVICRMRPWFPHTFLALAHLLPGTHPAPVPRTHLACFALALISLMISFGVSLTDPSSLGACRKEQGCWGTVREGDT